MGVENNFKFTPWKRLDVIFRWSADIWNVSAVYLLLHKRGVQGNNDVNEYLVLYLNNASLNFGS